MKEASAAMRRGCVVRLPDWHPEMGIAVVDNVCEWVSPTWDGFRSTGMLAHMAPLLFRTDWEVCWEPSE